MFTRKQLIAMFGSERTYEMVKEIVIEHTGEWHEAEEITAQTSMFNEDDTVPNPEKN